jgi:hypothetical protein
MPFSPEDLAFLIKIGQIQPTDTKPTPTTKVEDSNVSLS